MRWVGVKVLLWEGGGNRREPCGRGCWFAAGGLRFGVYTGPVVELGPARPSDLVKRIV